MSELLGPNFEGCVAQGIDEYSLGLIEQLALAHPKVYAAFGCHPKSAGAPPPPVRLGFEFELCNLRPRAFGARNKMELLHNNISHLHKWECAREKRLPFAEFLRRNSIGPTSVRHRRMCVPLENDWWSWHTIVTHTHTHKQTHAFFKDHMIRNASHNLCYL